jgi:protease-4
MMGRIVIVLLLSVSMVWGQTSQPAANPSDQAAPSTQPAGEVELRSVIEQARKLLATSQPVSEAKPVESKPDDGKPAEAKPAEAKAGDAKPPDAKLTTPTELAMKMRRQQEARDAMTKVAYLDLSSPVTEKPASFSLFGSDDQVTLRQVIERLHKARDDKKIRSVLMTFGAEMAMNLAQAQEIRDTLLELRRAGKKTFVYADSYDTIGYTVASGATNICLMEGGEIMIPGIGLETMFYKGTLDKVGVQADYIQIGEFKGAEEPYTRTGPSEELRSELKQLTEALYNQIIDGISLSRNVSSASVRQMIDDAMMTAQVAKDRGFVDHIVDQDGLRALLKEEHGNDVDLLRDYGAPPKPKVDFSNPFSLLATLGQKPPESDKPAVAVIYAEGVIVDGEGGASLFGDEGVGSDAMRRTMRTAARDDKVKAIVLRIDSPGGSALASEAMWQAIRRVADDSKKPVIVSIGSMAASGGYYLACAGDYIFADRCAIIGSIGVVGGKFVLKDLYDKLGLATEEFTQGRNADLFSSNAKWSERQRRMVRTWMQQTYDQFTQRVMKAREGKVKDIDKVARGRIFVAQQAKELGMIDELGGCEAAIAYAAKQAGLEKGKYDVRTLPQPKTLADLLSAVDGEEARTIVQPKVTINALDPALQALPANIRKHIGQQLRLMQMMEKRPVMLVSPYVITVK